MATFKYFAEIDGQAFELAAVWPAGVVAQFAKASGTLADGRRVEVSRSIEMKRMPSRHVCDARCLNAAGRVMKCECSCGGKNHGRGH